MNYQFLDTEDLEIQEECISKQTMVGSMISEYNSFWGEESTWRVPFRCKICPDAIGDSSDIAALDTWRGGSPKGEDEGFNAAIVRTKKGLDLLNEAAKAGYIKIGDELKIEDIDDFQPHQVNKKESCIRKT